MKQFKVTMKDSMPMVGPFFVIGSDLVAHATKLTDADKYEGTYNDTLSHNNLYYNYIAPKYGFSQHSEWERYPRGRVVAKTLANGTKRYYVFMDKCILYKQNIRDKVLNEYNLPAESVVWKNDSHYKCANCGAMVLPDLDDFDDTDLY